MSEQTTVRQAIQNAVSRGITQKDARYALAHALNLPVNHLKITPDAPITADQLRAFDQLVSRLLAGEPLAYVINHSDFMGLDFYINTHTLIPRNETEQLVEWVTEHLNTMASPRVLDMCTGSGCIVVSLLHAEPTAQGVGVDISEQALAVATRNANSNGVGERVRFVCSDLFAALDPGLRFDIIVSNPPYIPTHEMQELEPSVAEHEPHLALHGGDSGLDFYEAIAKQAHNYLTEHGVLFLEIGYNQGLAVKALLEQNGYQHVQIEKDYFGHDRMVLAHR